MKVVQTKKKSKSLLLRIALAALLVYSIIAIVNQQLVIAQKTQQMSGYSAQLKDQQLRNDELKQLVGNGDNRQYMEKAARDTLNYAEPDERVFVNVAGN